MEAHSHNTLELYYVIEGQVDIFYMPAGSNTAKTVTLFQKEFLLFRPNVYHSINSEVENLKVFNLELTVNPTAANAYEYLSKNPYVNKFPIAVSLLNKWKDILIFSDTQNTSHILKKFKNYPEKKVDLPYFAANLEIDLKRLFLEIVQCSQENINVAGHNTYIKKALLFIETHYQRNITLQNIADHLKISIPHLQRIFRQSFDETVLHYINKVRINKAKQLIIETNLPISSIADSVGYNSVQAFNTRFKEFTDNSPTQYRKNETHKYVRYKNLFK